MLRGRVTRTRHFSGEPLAELERTDLGLDQTVHGLSCPGDVLELLGEAATATRSYFRNRRKTSTAMGWTLAQKFLRCHIWQLPDGFSLRTDRDPCMLLSHMDHP